VNVGTYHLYPRKVPCHQAAQEDLPSGAILVDDHIQAKPPPAWPGR